MVSDNIQDVDAELSDYELTIIVNPETSEEAAEAAVESISQFVSQKGGVISEVEHWGKKRLAYPVKHLTEGNYVLTRLRMKPEHNQELEASLRISEGIIRHLLIRLS